MKKENYLIINHSLIFILFTISSIVNAENYKCSQLKKQSIKIKNLIITGEFKKLRTITDSYLPHVTQCQKKYPRETHQMLIAALQASKKFKLNNEKVNNLLFLIKNNLDNLNGKDKDKWSFEIIENEISILIKQQKYNKALSIAKKALVTYSNNNLTNRRYHRLWANITRIYFFQNNFTSAIESSLYSIELLNKYDSTNYATLGWYYNNLAAAYYYLGDFEKAKDQFKLAEKSWLQTYPKTHITFASLYLNLGSVISALEKGLELDSLEYYKKALKIYNSQYSSKHPLVVTVIGNIASIYQHLNDMKNAGKYFNIYIKNFDYDSNEAGKTFLGEYVKYLLFLNKHKKAQHWLDIIISNSNKNKMSNKTLAIALNSYVKWLTEKGMFDEAIKQSSFRLKKAKEYAVNHTDNFLDLNAFYNSKEQQQFVDIYTNLLLEIKNKKIKKLNKSSINLFLDILATFYVTKYNYVHYSDQINKKIHQLKSEKNRLLQKTSNLIKIEDEIEKNNKKISQLSAQIEELKNEQHKKYNPPSLTLDSVQKLIQKNESLLVLRMHSNKLIALVVNHNNYFLSAIESINKNDITLFIKNVKQSNINYTFDLKEFNYKLAYKISSNILKNLPLNNHIKIIMNNFIEEFPIEALPLVNSSTHSKYFVEEYKLSYIAGINSLFNQEKKYKNLPSISFGDPLLNSDSTQFRNIKPIILSKNYIDNYNKIKKLPQLNYANTELTLFKQSIPNAHIYTKENFTKLNITKNLNKQYNIVSFISHALTIIDNNYSYPALVLTPTKNNSTSLTNGLFTTQEIEKLNFKANLLILSGCNTNSPEDSSHNDLSGLAASFAIAGANNIMVSTNQIDDQATSILMGNFYNNINNGYSSALQQAMKKLINSVDYNHPYYWANFRLIKN